MSSCCSRRFDWQEEAFALTILKTHVRQLSTAPVYGGNVRVWVSKFRGGSFIGMEVASSLAKKGCDVAVIAMESVPFERVLGKSHG